MARYAARRGLVYMNIGSGSPSTTLGMAQWRVNRKTRKIDVTAFGDTNITYVQGLPDGTGNFRGFWDDTEAKPFTAVTSTNPISIYLYPSSDILTHYWYGTVWADLGMEAQVNGAVTVETEFAAATALSWV